MGWEACLFGIGIMELVVLAIIVLLFVGPRRLPQVMHQCGKMFVRLRRMSSEARDTFDHIIRTAEREVDQETAIKTINKLTAASAQESDRVTEDNANNASSAKDTAGEENHPKQDTDSSSS